jgi:undecaprenyl-diphosphatase
MLEAILLGILQGLTEFLPISSSGHLVLGEHALGLSGGRSNILFEVLLHLGTLLAVLVAYRHDVGELLAVLWPWHARRLVPEERRRRQRLIGAILVASVPAGIIGLTLKDPITALFGEPRVVAFLLLGTALILFIGDRLKQGGRLAEESGPARALFIGLAQALAILPGISRSGSTIVAGLAMGLRPVEAARFSFLIMLPAVSGAALLEFLDVLKGQTTTTLPLPALAAGFISSAVVGYLALQWLLIAIRRRSLTLFACYCALAGTLALLFGNLG